VEPDVVSNQPKINRNTFKIGSGDLQQQVAENTKRIGVISTLLRSSRKKTVEGLRPQATQIQQSLEQSNLILADIAIQLQQDFQDRKQAERLKLTKNREEQLELKRTDRERDIEYKKTEKKITKTSNKIKGPLGSLFDAIGKIIMLFGGLVLIKTLLTPGLVNNIINSEQVQTAKVALEATFEVLTKNMKAILVVAGAIVGLKIAATLAVIYKVGAGFLAILANPLVLAGVGALLSAGLQGLGGNEKDVVKQLQEMGGFSKENRDALAQKYKEELEAMPFLERQIKKGEYESRIKFLETGDFSSGGRKAVFDWSKMDGLEELSDFENFMINFSYDHFSMRSGDPDGLVRENNNNNTTIIELPGETIDLTKKNNGSNIIETSNFEANQVTMVSSVDTTNRYVNEFPITAGFNESVYS